MPPGGSYGHSLDRNRGPCRWLYLLRGCSNIIKEKKMNITLDDMKKAKNILLSMKRHALLVKSKEELADVNFLIKVFADLSAGTIKV